MTHFRADSLLLTTLKDSEVRLPTLQQKTIWLTGASSGIGEAVARRLGRINCRLALTARREERLREIAQELKGHGATVEIYPGDVTDREAMSRIAQRIEEDLGPVDILFTCAGAYEPTDPERFDSADYAATMEVNYAGTLHCVNAVLPGMIKRRQGYLAIMSSIVAYRGLPRSCSYGATKAVLVNFFEGLRFDLRKYNIAVSLVNPGFVRSSLTDKNDFPMPFRIEPDEAARRIVNGLRRGRAEIHFPWQFTWTMKLLRVIPFPVYNLLIGRFVAR